MKNLLILSLFAVSLCWARNPRAEKLCWAHFVSWGMHFEKNYDRFAAANPLGDRTLLGKQVNTDLGIYSSTRIQVEEALKYGIDGFCIDVTIPKAYKSVMHRLCSAAEGLPFYMALCVDGWKDTPLMVESLAAYLDHCGDHPNTCKIDGKPVIFIYNPGHSPKKCKEVVDALAAQGKYAYWLVQPQRETTLWKRNKTSDAYLDCFDGLYDFGINGYTKADMVTRLTNGRKAIEACKPGGVLVGGITQGYIGPHNAFYRPFLNTGTFRDNWDACIETQCDWVCLTTWNDYNESTHFEPSIWGRDLLLRYNQERLRTWRGEELFPRPADALVSYQECCRLGDDFEIEAVVLPYTTQPAKLELKILDGTGAIKQQFPAKDLPPGKTTVSTFRLNDVGLDGQRLLIPWARLLVGEGKDSDWKRLAPVQIVPNSQRRVRLYRQSLRETFTQAPELQAKEEKGNLQLTLSFRSWTWWGKATLLQNGRPLEVKEIEKFGGIQTKIGFNLPAEKRQQACDYLNIRLDRKDRKVAWSKPYLWRKSPASPRTFEVYCTARTLDEFWMQKTKPARTEPGWKTTQIDPAEFQKLVYPCLEGEESLIYDKGHQVALIFGAGKHMSPRKDNAPKWESTIGPEGGQRSVLAFSGNEWLSFPSRTAPPLGQTFQLVFKAGKQDNDAFLLSDACCGMEIKLDKEGYLHIGIKGEFSKSNTPLPANSWNHVAGVYDGKTLSLFLNSQCVASRKLEEPLMFRWNSRARIGNIHRLWGEQNNCFKGKIAYIQWDARALETEEFHRP